jgi:hypothetical protein
MFTFRFHPFYFFIRKNVGRSFGSLELRQMRVLGIYSLILCPLFASGQTKIADSAAIRPQAIVQVSKTKVGADLVLITVLDHDYPPRLLQSQANGIGSLTPGGARGLQVFQSVLKKDDPESSFWKASFAVNGLIDAVHGTLSLQPIVRAMAGAPAPHTIQQFYVEFDGVKVQPATLGSYFSPSVQITRELQGPTIEYGVTLLSQNPQEIQIPDSNSPPVTRVGAKGSASGTDWVVFGAFGVGALAAGALVYSLLLTLLRSSGRTRLRR